VPRVNPNASSGNNPGTEPAATPQAAPPGAPAPGDAASPRRVHPNVVALGAASLLTDVSSEMVLPVLPLFLTETLRASVASLGLIEGVAESAASLLRLGTGWLSDRLGWRKPFIVSGYGLSTVSKAGFAFATSWLGVFGFRFGDRLGKAIRTPPRDALLADSSDPRDFGRSFGLHRAMDNAGAAIGPLAAFAILGLFPGDFRRVFLFSFVPGALSVIVLVVFVKAVKHRAAAFKSFHVEWKALGGPFHRFIVTDGLFRLGSSSLAFVLLRARQSGFTDAQVPLVYFAFNIVTAVLAYPLGGLSDRVGRRGMVLAGYLLFALNYAGLALFAGRVALLAAFVVLGVHTALIDGQQKSLIADLVPPDRRGTAFGVYHMVVGVALLPASVMAGFVWDRFGASATFGLDAGLAFAAALLFVVLVPLGHEWKARNTDAHAR
jgi:MFS family permease